MSFQWFCWRIYISLRALRMISHVAWLGTGQFQSAFSAFYLIWPGFSCSPMFQKLTYQTYHLILLEVFCHGLYQFSSFFLLCMLRRLSAACELRKGILHRFSQVSLGSLPVSLSYYIDKFIIKRTGRLNWFKIFQLPELQRRSVKEPEYGVQGGGEKTRSGT